MIEAWAKSEGKQIRLEEYVDRMKEGQKDIFALPLNLQMLALNCMRGGLHCVSALMLSPLTFPLCLRARTCYASQRGGV